MGSTLAVAYTGPTSVRGERAEVVARGRMGSGLETIIEVLSEESCEDSLANGGVEEGRVKITGTGAGVSGGVRTGVSGVGQWWCTKYYFAPRA